MFATIAESRRFHRAEDIITDLLGGLDPAGGGIGFLTCDATIDGAAVAAGLARAAGFPVVGGTTLAFPGSAGSADVSARLAVYRRPGVAARVAVSPPLEAQNSAAQMAALYRDCVDGLPGAPALVCALAPMMPGHAGEPFLLDLLDAAGDVPLFGGMTSADLDSEAAAVFAGGQAHRDRIVLAAFSGDIRPVFSVGSRLSLMTDYSPTVTEARGNVVYRLDGAPACDYLRRTGLIQGGGAGGMAALFQFGPLPVLVRGRGGPESAVPEIRGISATSGADGSILFTSPIPEGARITLGNLQRGDILESAEDAMRDLRRQMSAATDYDYSLMLSVPCVARYFAQVGGEDLETQVLESYMPPGLPALSFYSFCEIGPVPTVAGPLHNRTHADSIVLCAI